MLYLVGTFLLFSALLLVAVFVIFKKSKKDENIKEPNGYTLETLVSIVKNENKEVLKIEEALNHLVTSFPFPENINEAKKHFEFVYLYAKNPLSTAKMIINMQKKVSKANPKFSKEIEKFQMRGVEDRSK